MGTVHRTWRAQVKPCYAGNQTGWAPQETRNRKLSSGAWRSQGADSRLLLSTFHAKKTILIKQKRHTGRDTSQRSTNKWPASGKRELRCRYKQDNMKDKKPQETHISFTRLKRIVDMWERNFCALMRTFTRVRMHITYALYQCSAGELRCRWKQGNMKNKKLQETNSPQLTLVAVSLLLFC